MHAVYGILYGRGVLQDIRTLRGTKEFEEMLENMRFIREHFEGASEQKPRRKAS